MPLYKSLEPSMPGGLRLRCPDATLAGLAGLAGWLGWLAAAGGLLLAGCCWLMGGSLDALGRSADFCHSKKLCLSYIRTIAMTLQQTLK